MARKRTEFTPDIESQILAHLSRGGTAESISAALTSSGVKGASRSTIGRRIAELRGKGSSFAQDLAAAGGASSEPGDAPDEQGDPPTAEEIEGADPATLDRLLARAEAAGRKAAAAGNLPGIGAMGRLALQIQVEKRKAAPVVPPDPNDAPDMIALGREVAERLHKMVDLVVDG